MPIQNLVASSQRSKAASKPTATATSSCIRLRTFLTGNYQSEIAYLLRTLLSNGRVATECPISTADGVELGGRYRILTAPSDRNR